MYLSHFQPITKKGASLAQKYVKEHFVTKLFFVHQLLDLKCLEVKNIFFSFQHNFMANAFFPKMQATYFSCYASSLWRYSFKTSNPSKTIHPKIFKASRGIISVFFVVSWARYFGSIENAFVLAKKPPNPTYSIQGSLSYAQPKHALDTGHVGFSSFLAKTTLFWKD